MAWGGVGWGAEPKKGYDRKEEREGKVMIMTNYYCDAQQRGEARGESRQQPEKYILPTPPLTCLFVCGSCSFDRSIYSGASGQPAGRPKKIIMCYSSVHHVFLLYTVPTCQGCRPQFATTPKIMIFY